MEFKKIRKFDIDVDYDYTGESKRSKAYYISFKIPASDVTEEFFLMCKQMDFRRKQPKKVSIEF